MVTEIDSMQAVSARLDNPVYVLLMAGEVWEVWTDFLKAYDKYQSSEDMQMAIVELKGGQDE